MIIYDWLLTFPDEIRLIWRQKLTGARVLFILNRYSTIALYITGIISDFLLGVAVVIGFPPGIKESVSMSFTGDHHNDAHLYFGRGTAYNKHQDDSWIILAFSCSSTETIIYALTELHDLVVSGSSFNTMTIAHWLMRHILFDGPVFQILRVYAISGRKWQPAVLVAVFNAYPMSFVIVSSSSWTWPLLRLLRCGCHV